MIGLGLSIPEVAVRRSGGFSPSDLGASLLALWDAERADKMTLSGANVSTWADLVGGYSLSQAISGSKPVWSSGSFNGRPGVTFDGTDDCLDSASVPFPFGSDPCEFWIAVDQQTPDGDATIRVIFGYATSSNGFSRRDIRRSTSGGTSIITGQIGTGSAQAAVGTIVGGAFNGRNVGRLAVGPSTSSIYRNGTLSQTVATVPATGNNLMRMGGLVSATAANFFQGVVSAVLVTSPLSTDQAASLTAYLKSRGGIA